MLMFVLITEQDVQDVQIASKEEESYVPVRPEDISYIPVNDYVTPCDSLFDRWHLFPLVYCMKRQKHSNVLTMNNYLRKVEPVEEEGDYKADSD